MRLIDADKLNRKDVNCANTPMNFIDTAPTVKAIPKADYEVRLKADMVAILNKIKDEIEKVFCISVVTNELRTPMEVKTEISQIIDKHIKESEG